MCFEVIWFWVKKPFPVLILSPTRPYKWEPFNMKPPHTTFKECLYLLYITNASNRFAFFLLVVVKIKFVLHTCFTPCTWSQTQFGTTPQVLMLLVSNNKVCNLLSPKQNPIHLAIEVLLYWCSKTRLKVSPTTHVITEHEQYDILSFHCTVSWVTVGPHF